MYAEKPKDWERYMATLQFGYREVPYAKVEFSLFDMLYGRYCTVARPVIYQPVFVCFDIQCSVTFFAILSAKATHETSPSCHP